MKFKNILKPTRGKFFLLVGFCFLTLFLLGTVKKKVHLNSTNTSADVNFETLDLHRMTKVMMLFS